MLPSSLTTFNKDKSLVELRIIPNIHGPVSAEDISEQLIQAEYLSLRPDNLAIEKATNKINSLYGQSDGDKTHRFIIAERRNASIDITVSTDNMHAYMTLTAAWGGTSLTLTNILNALKRQNIKMGLSKRKILALLHKLAILPAGKTCSNEIAHGKPAINGDNATIMRKVTLARERLLQPQKRDDGTVDMHDLGAVIIVKPNDILMVKQPATKGTPGYDVHGITIHQIPGKDKVLLPGSGTGLNPKNLNQLVATKSGLPIETNGSLRVDNTLMVRNVNANYGHVEFKGSVFVTGDIEEGMQVKASGDIIVLGFVNSATLEAKGDVVVHKGIIGRQNKKEQLSTTVKAKGKICAKFVQYSRLDADDDILITQQLLHSHSTSKQQVTVSDTFARRGDLVGGRTEAAKGITAIALGATSGTKTELFCAMDKDEYKNQLRELNQSIKSLAMASLNLNSRLKQLPPKSKWQRDIKMIRCVKTMINQKKMVSDELIKEKFEQKTKYHELHDYFDNYFIKANKQIFSNVIINVGNATNYTLRDHGPCVIKNVNQKVDFDYSND